MPMDPPGFWSAPPGKSITARLLSPLGQLYHWEVQRRLASTRPYRPGVPVICVGNATTGGVGKTPFVRWLADKLEGLGHQPHVLTRGYGGTETGPLRVRPSEHSAASVGDEPLMLAQDFPVWVCRNRAAGAEAAEAAGADVLVMDDGLQNPSLAKDLSFLLVDAATLFGNGAVFPAGPLREKPQAALARSQAVVAMLGDSTMKPPRALKHFAGDRSLIEAWFDIDPSAIPDAPLVAMCGIGRPERFFAALNRHGADVVDFAPFPDHHPFTMEDLDAVHQNARRLGATVVTTEKDFVRIAPDAREGLIPVPGRIHLRDERPVTRLLETLR